MPEDASALRRCRALFERAFAAAPTVIARAPGRVNLIGEHVDYAEGLVLPIAIERATFVAARQVEGDRSSIVSEAMGSVALDVTRPTERRTGADAWANYVVGPMRELAERGGHESQIPNVEIAVVSDVPLGGGLSSSAALEVAATLAMTGLMEIDLDGLEVARLCQRAEHRYAGTPCGIMDMTVSANARAGHALLLDCRTLAMQHLAMPVDHDVLVVDSGVRHQLTDGGYASRRASVELAARRLGVRALRDATAAQVEAADLDATTRRRARHVTSEIARTVEAAAALQRGDVSRFGALMYESHRSLRDDFSVSTPELDCLVESFRAADGTAGARLTGGGFGGCVVALVAAAGAHAVTAQVLAEFAQRFSRTPISFRTRAAAGAARSSLYNAPWRLLRSP